MNSISFADNLYGRAGIAGGCGLKGFARVAAWAYERHDSYPCKPGLWRVSLTGGPEMGEFWPLVNHSMHAVIDDFGNLVPVGVQ